MKILTRYLTLELIKPFLFCLVACSALWMMSDLFGSLDDFLDHKAKLGLVVQYYAALYPRLLLEVLPVSVLAATTVGLLNLGRNREIVALLAGGISPETIFRPFLVLAVLSGFLLSYLLAAPASLAERQREAILKLVRGETTQQNIFPGVIYRDYDRHLIWYAQLMEVSSGGAEQVELLLQDEAGRDVVKYFAESATWDGHSWTLNRVREFRPTQTVTTNGIPRDGMKQTLLPTITLPEIDIPPARMTAVQQDPEQMTRTELVDFLDHSEHLPPSRLAPYLTQWHHGLAYALTPLILTLFALALAFNINRRTTTAAVGQILALLLTFFFVSKFFLALGRSDRIAPLLAAWLIPLASILAALFILAPTMGWPVRRWLR